jgi:hypothetical protein
MEWWYFQTAHEIKKILLEIAFLGTLLSEYSLFWIIQLFAQ